MFERFVYDGISCSEYGIMCVSFEPTARNTVSAQSTTLTTHKSVSGDAFHIVSQSYSEPLSYTVQIVNRDFSPISSIQERTLKKWLCRKGTYKLFCVLDKRFADTWFYGNLNNPKSIIINDTVGLEFTVTTNAPFAFSDLRVREWQLNGNENIQDLYVNNDEELPIYPTITITPMEAGALTLRNASIENAPNTLILNNLSEGETITLECGYPHISSSLASHHIFDDFNKYWPYLIDGCNRITVDRRCRLAIEYREYRKVGLV